MPRRRPGRDEAEALERGRQWSYPPKPNRYTAFHALSRTRRYTPVMDHDTYRKVSAAVQDGCGEDRELLLAMLAGVMPRREIERALQSARAARERLAAGA